MYTEDELRNLANDDLPKLISYCHKVQEVAKRVAESVHNVNDADLKDTLYRTYIRGERVREARQLLGIHVK